MTETSNPAEKPSEEEEAEFRAQRAENDRLAVEQERQRREKRAVQNDSRTEKVNYSFSDISANADSFFNF